MIEELKEFSDANRWKRMQMDTGGCRRMGADIMYQFESVVIRLNQFLVFKEEKCLTIKP